MEMALLADQDVSTQKSPSCRQKYSLLSNWEQQWSLSACGNILPGMSVLRRCDSSQRPELISLLNLFLAAALRVGRLCPGCRLGWPLTGARSMSEQPWTSSMLFGLADLSLSTGTSCFSGLIFFRCHGHSRDVQTSLCGGPWAVTTPGSCFSCPAALLSATTTVPPLPRSLLMGSVESHVGSGATRRVFKAQEQELTQD